MEHPEKTMEKTMGKTRKPAAKSGVETYRNSYSEVNESSNDHPWFDTFSAVLGVAGVAGVAQKTA